MNPEPVLAVLAATALRLGLPPATLPAPARRLASYLPLGLFAVLYRPVPWTISLVAAAWLILDLLESRSVSVATADVLVTTAGLYALASGTGWQLGETASHAVASLGSAVDPTRLAAILTGFILVLHPANRVVREVLSITGVGTTDGESSPAGFLPQPGETDGGRELRIGRMVGNLERLVILTLLLRGDSSLAVGLVLTAKSVARFDELKNRRRAEYYIVGTLASILIALLVAAALDAVAA